MINTPLTSAAANLAQKAHAGQVDRAGEPYINHPLTVAESMDTEEATCVALLHDVLEDSDFTADDLRAIGMSEEVVAAVELLTHDPAVDYFEYILQVRENPLAAKVKHADLEHNADMSRYIAVTAMDRRRESKYLKALDLLDGRDELCFDGTFASQHSGMLEARRPAAPPAPEPPAAAPRG